MPITPIYYHVGTAIFGLPWAPRAPLADSGKFHLISFRFSFNSHGFGSGL